MPIVTLVVGQGGTIAVAGGDGVRPSLSAEQLVGAVPQLEGASLTVRTLRSARPWP